MWIAKPLHALSPSERSAWIDLIELLGESAPLSQTLAWGEAIQAVGGRAFLIFNPEDGVGGLVHQIPQGTSQGLAQAGAFECVNGPLLHWDHAERIARQLATFAMAASKLTPGFSSIQMQPRWLACDLERRRQLLPVEPIAILEAATLQVEVQASELEQLASMSSRLRRTLTIGQRVGVQVETRRVLQDETKDFMRGARAYGEAKGFYVPEPKWVETLIQASNGSSRETLEFWLTSARWQADGKKASTELLTCVQGRVAHYLIGFGERDDDISSSISTSAVAHFDVLKKCIAQKIEIYDLNGFTDPNDLSHPYAGVSRFKAQFQGKTVQYVSPVFRVEA